jgi:hypothetical protein
MKNFLFLAMSFFALQIGFAQNITNNSNENTYNSAGVDVKPQYPGGISKFYQFIANNYKTPTAVDFLGGKVFVSFIIEKDGSVADIKVLRDVGFGTGEEAIRVLELCPKWSPGYQNGQNVRCSYSLPIALQAYVFKALEVERKPEFVGGMQNFYEFVGRNYKMPEVEGLNGSIYITFIVEIDGSLTGIKVLKDIGHGTGEEALRVLKKCPNWFPAQHKGQKVRCSYSLPIKLQSS